MRTRPRVRAKPGVRWTIRLTSLQARALAELEAGFAAQFGATAGDARRLVTSAVLSRGVGSLKRELAPCRGQQ